MKAFQNLRRKVGAMIGGFEGGLSARRLKTFAASRAHINTLIQAAGADMTARARYLIRNNGYAANAVESWAGNAEGTGIKPSSGISDASLKTPTSYREETMHLPAWRMLNGSFRTRIMYQSTINHRLASRRTDE